MMKPKHRQEYTAPELVLIDVAVEAGFAASPVSKGDSSLEDPGSGSGWGSEI